MEESTISFGNTLSYLFKYIIIDHPFGYPILLDGVAIGGILIESKNIRGDIKTVFFEGIELIPEYRRNGIATKIIELLKEQSELILGAITDEDAKPFWLKVGAVFHDIPVDLFNEQQRKTLHTQEPKMFYITRSLRAKEFCEDAAKILPTAIKTFSNMQSK